MSVLEAPAVHSPIDLGPALLALLLLVPDPTGLATQDQDHPDERGARALRGETWSTPVVEAGDLTRAAPVHPTTPPVAELYVKPSYYDDGCHVPISGTEVLPGCTYGDPEGDVQVAVLGDSKVGSYVPALEEIALREGWSLRTYTKSACAYLVDAPAKDYPQCDDYNEALTAHLEADPPDIVLTSTQRRHVTTATVRTWEHLRASGVERVVALWDLPSSGANPAECVAAALVAGTDLLDCATEARDVRSGSLSLRAAAAQVPGSHFVDLRDWVCPESWVSPACAPVVGRVQVFGQGSHLTDHYASTLTDPLHQRLHEIGVARHAPLVDREAGADRFATSALLSRHAGTGGRVWVAGGQDYPDALAAAARAGHDASAVLLVREDDVPGATRDALTRLAPSQIVVVGGPSAVGPSVLETLRGYAPQVQRVAGAHRYATAAAVATHGRAARGGRVYVASGEEYADALAAGARAGADGSPVLLVRPDRVPEETAGALRELAPRQVVVVGGEAAVGDGVLAEVREIARAPVGRVHGEQRYATAAALAAGTARGGVVHVSVGTDHADALAAAPAAALAEGPVLLVTPTHVPSDTARAIRAIAPSRIVLTGGPQAIAEEVEHDLFGLLPQANVSAPRSASPR